MQSTKIATVFQPTLEDVTRQLNNLRENVKPNTNLEDIIAQDIYILTTHFQLLVHQRFTKMQSTTLYILWIPKLQPTPT